MRVGNLKDVTAAGKDQITGEMIKGGSDRVVDWILRLCNIAFESDAVPEDWRSAVIVPLYKGKEEKTDCKNYRGISLLCVVGKIYGGWEASGFNFGGVRGPSLVLFLFYMNVSEMRPRSRFSSKPLTIPALWVILRDVWSIPVVYALGDCLPFSCGE